MRYEMSWWSVRDAQYENPRWENSKFGVVVGVICPSPVVPLKLQLRRNVTVAVFMRVDLAFRATGD